jgi:SAM-dependent methyltransferase
MVRMSDEKNVVKEDIENFYEKQSAEKTADFEKWLNSGSPRIPQPTPYYYFEDRKIDNALAMAQLKKNAKILEVGCNLGQMTFVLNQKGYSITGTDLSPNAISKAKARIERYNLSNIAFEVQDAENIQGHTDEEFDAVFSFSAFRYFPNPDNALRECFRLVKKGGVAVIDFPNKACPWFSMLKPAVHIKKHIHDNLFTAAQVCDMMKQAGFVDIEIRQFLFTYKELPPIVLPIMKIADFILERIPIINKMSAIVMVKGRRP